MIWKVKPTQNYKAFCQQTVFRLEVLLLPGSPACWPPCIFTILEQISQRSQSLLSLSPQSSDLMMLIIKINAITTDTILKALDTKSLSLYPTRLTVLLSSHFTDEETETKQVKSLCKDMQSV